MFNKIIPCCCEIPIRLLSATLFRAPAKPPEKPLEIAPPAMVPVAAAPPIKEEGIMSIAVRAAVPAAIAGLIGLMSARAER